MKPHRKHPKNGFTKEETRENEEIAQFRGDIERHFGIMETKFGIVKKIFRHGDLVVNAEIKLCMFKSFHCLF